MKLSVKSVDLLKVHCTLKIVVLDNTVQNTNCEADQMMLLARSMEVAIRMMPQQTDNEEGGRLQSQTHHSDYSVSQKEQDAGSEQ